jgi:hypothetical protein
MNENAQFKVALKRYLNIHCFYSVEEFLTFKIDSYCLLYGPCIYVYTYVKLLLCYLYSILKKVFVCGFVSLFVCFVFAEFICFISL